VAMVHARGVCACLFANLRLYKQDQTEYNISISNLLILSSLLKMVMTSMTMFLYWRRVSVEAPLIELRNINSEQLQAIHQAVLALDGW